MDWTLKAALVNEIVDVPLIKELRPITDAGLALDPLFPREHNGIVCAKIAIIGFHSCFFSVEL
jgi:hypothetical protein